MQITITPGAMRALEKSQPTEGPLRPYDNDPGCQKHKHRSRSRRHVPFQDTGGRGRKPVWYPHEY